MRDLGTTIRRRCHALQHLALAATLGAFGVVAAQGCGGGSTTSTSSSSHATGSSASSTTATTGSGGTGGATTTSTTSTTATTGSGGTGGTGGMAPTGCTVTAKGTTRGSAIAITPDDKTLITVNRDAGTVTVASITIMNGEPVLTMVGQPLAVGGEPWQVAIDGCGTTAYVVLRKDQKVVEITGLGTATPALGKSVSVGSEPTAIAITPRNTKLYVANWVDGTLSVIDPVGMVVTGTVNLNKTIAATGLLGTVTARPALAHPRALAITNNGPSDTDEKVYATEWFAVRTGPEDATGTHSDHNWKGLLYQVQVGMTDATTMDLPPIVDTGFKDIKDQATGCFPNQVGSVTIDGGFAYVTSTCASPVGPIGVFTGKNAGGSCTLLTEVADCGAGGSCNLSAIPSVCKPNTRGVKTTTHPALTIVKLSDGTGNTTALDKSFEALNTANSLGLRSPLLPTDMAFIKGGGVGYITGEGADAAFRISVANGAISGVGTPGLNNFIDLRTTLDKTIRLPIGVAIANASAFAFVANDGNHDITAVDLAAQTVANTATVATFHTTDLTQLTAQQLSELKGKRFFNTGLGRWSLNGQAWGSCGACHVDGLSDNVTWYFARGPRQTVSLDGTFASKDGTDQRILNWSGIFDEVADFEGNTRGISGGVGALVKAPTACTVASDCTPGSGVCTAGFCAVGTQDRINTATLSPPQQGLQGSSTDIADPNGMSGHPHSVIPDWLDITAWVKAIRSPRKPSNLVQADVDAGKALFSGAAQAHCDGCHSGPKWTISKRFYTPGDVPNTATADANPLSLSNITWKVALNGFLPTLFPATTNQFMRSGAPPAFEQIQCVLRPVGTIKLTAGVPAGVSSTGLTGVNVLELRQDMTTPAQGAGAGGNDFTVGFNPPSLLGLQVGAPYLHAGNARTLEEVLDDTLFHSHHAALNVNFVPTATQIPQLVAYLLSIDEDEPVLTPPAKGAAGGALCF